MGINFPAPTNKASYMKNTVDKMETGKEIPKDSSLEGLFLEELKELYGAEKHQLLILPMLKKASSSMKLQNVLASHLDDTRQHILRLEGVFVTMGQVAEARLSEAILGISREGEIVIEATEKESATRDAGIIVAAQKLEHYEITGYGSLAQHARTLEYDDIEEILELTLVEEKEADDLLTALAENYINIEAAGEKTHEGPADPRSSGERGRVSEANS
jgi:ferritin-like metal-binding protein YciE